MKRQKISFRITDKLMFDNDHTCCMCRHKGKEVEIHHIDGNKNNNDPSNLAVLCRDCHALASRKGLGRSYTIGELKQYKKSWELTIKKQRGIYPKKERTRKQISPIEILGTEIL